MPLLTALAAPAALADDERVVLFHWSFDVPPEGTVQHTAFTVDREYLQVRVDFDDCFREDGAALVQPVPGTYDPLVQWSGPFLHGTCGGERPSYAYMNQIRAGTFAAAAAFAGPGHVEVHVTGVPSGR